MTTASLSLKSKRGFTLIELLVVMAIIGILAALSLTSFNTAQKNSRDTRRKSDLAQYRNTLEAYASNNNGQYPAEQARLCGNGTSDAGTLFTSCPTCPIIPNYLPAVIVPPVSTACGASPNWEYLYRGTNSGGPRYVLQANLETKAGATETHWTICSNGKAGFAARTGSAVYDCPF